MSEPADRHIRWLHFSDFHFRERLSLDEEKAFNALQSFLPEEGLRPDLVFITGDIAQSGKPAEFKRARERFARLAEWSQVMDRDHWFLIPGNHDVDRAAIRFGDEAIVDRLRQQEDIEEVFGDEDAMKALGRRLQSYYEFTGDFLGADRAWSFQSPWRTERRTIRGMTLAILQLNSSWACGKKEEERLLVGEIQVRQAMQEASGADLCIALVHHPLADLREWDFDAVRACLGTPGGVRFLLRGHRHTNDVVHFVQEHESFFELATGAGYTKDKYYTGFQAVDLDPDRGRVTVRMFRYSPKGFWAPDTLSDRAAREGIRTLDYRPPRQSALVPGEPRQERAGEPEDERVVDPADRGEAVQALIRLGQARGWRLRDVYRVREGYDLLWWAAGHDKAERFEIVLDTAEAHSEECLHALIKRFSPSRAHTWKPLHSAAHIRSVVASELGLESYARGAIADFAGSSLSTHFINLWAEEPGGRKHSAQELFEEWLADPTLVHLTLVGELGAGKTSLTRKWTGDLAAAYLEKPGERRAPVRVDLAAAAGGEAEDLVRASLGVSAERVSDELLHLAIEQGLLVILLDGFDEMAARSSEKEILDSYTELSQLARGPRSKVLFTCRTSSFSTSASFEVGFAALEERARRLGVTRGGFRVATLLALGPDQIRHYVERHIPEKRERTKLQERIEKLYNLQDLSTRPLLLRMIVSLKDPLLELHPDTGAGGGIYRATLYRMFTDQWVHRHRDAPSQTLLPEQKAAISLVLARALWDQGSESLPLNDLLRVVVNLLPGDPALPDFLHKAAIEIRTASFLVRDGENHLRFAHKSFLEYFVARDVFLRLTEGREDALPERWLSEEVTAFLHEMLEEDRADDLRDRLEAGIRSGTSDHDRAAALVASYRLRRVAQARRPEPIGSDFTRELENDWGRGLSLRGVTFDGLDLSFAYLAEADFRDASLEGTDFRGAVLAGADLRGARMASVRANGANLERALLADTDLDEASLAGACLSGADLRRSRLRAAHLDDAALPGALLDGARLRGARLCRTDLRGATARDAELDFSLLLEARLEGTDLTGASLSHAAVYATELSLSKGIPRTVRGAALAPRNPLHIELPQPPWWGGGATPSSVCWAPDGTRYGVSSWDGVVRLFDSKLGRLLTELPHERAVRRAVFSPDGTRLLTACDDGGMRLWSLEEERILLSCGPEKDSGRVISCSFSADGNRIAGAWNTRRVRVFDAGTGKLIAELRHERQVRDCAFVGLQLVTACGDGSARLWDLGSRKTVRILQSGTSRLRACAVSQDGRFLATGSEDLQVRIFDLTSPRDQPFAELPHGGPLWSCAFSRKGDLLATGADDGKARVFRVPEAKEVAVFEHGGWVWSCDFSPDADRLLTCCDDGTVRMFLVRTGRPERVVPHGRWVRSAVVSPDSRHILAACNDRAARVFDSETGSSLYEKEHGSWVRRCAISPDGRLALTVGGDAQARLFRLLDGELSIPSLDHEQRTRACAFAPDGTGFATGCADGMLRVYTVKGDLLHRFELKSEIWTAAFTADGRRILAGCHDGRVWLADTETGNAEVLDTLEGWVRACACSPALLAAGCGHSGLHLWDARTLERLAPLPHKFECWNAAFSPDGSKLLTAWQDSVVRCHAVDSRTEIVAIRNPGWTWTCSFFPDGKRILTGGDDGRLRIYRLPETPGEEPRLLLTIAAAFPLPHGQSPNGYLTLPDRGRVEGYEVVCEGARYPLSLLARVLNRPDYVQASQRGEVVPPVDEALASDFPAVSLPPGWPKP